MASSGSFNTSAYGSGNYHRYLTFSWSVQSQSVSKNQTTISWSLRGAGGSTNSWVQSGNFQVVINGTVVYSSATRINLYNGTVVASGTFTMSHDNNGNKSFSASAQAGIYTVAVNCSGSGSWSLPQIPRYATSNQSLNSKTETTITMNWSSNHTIDYIWYSTNNGSSWTGVDVPDGGSGSYTISGLAPNTTYNIKTRVRRKTNQLTTDSSALSVTTYSYPYANSMPNFTIGEKVTIGLYNPLARSVTVYMVSASGTEVSGGTTTATSMAGWNSTYFQNFMYSSIPNAQSGTYKIKVVYGANTTTTTGGTYSIDPAVCSPAISAVSYQDTNSATIAMTGNNQLIVQKNSTVRYTATGLTANNSATISACSVSVNGNSYAMTISGSTATGGNATIDSSGNVTATVTVTDSRGLTATKDVTVQMLEWFVPTAIITLQRHNNFYSETDINVNADYASINGKNTITIKARYKKISDTTYSSYVTLQDAVTSVLNLDNNFAWDVQVLVQDPFGSATYNTSISRGMPIIYFDRNLSSVGINCFPIDAGTLEVNGTNVLRSVMTRWLPADLGNLTANSYVKINLTGSNSSGEKLTATSDGGIKIGAGVSKIMVSARALISSNVVGTQYIRIAKNDVSVYDNMLAWVSHTNTSTTAAFETINVTPAIVDVAEDDVIYLYYYVPDSSSTIYGNTRGNQTSLTVETVG